MTPLTIKKLICAGLLVLAGLTRGLSQYQISGGINVMTGVNVAPYTISGGPWSTADKWCASTGTINGTSNSCVNNNGTPNVSVTWSSSGTLSYYLNGTGSPVATLAVSAYSITNNITGNANAEFAPDFYPFVWYNQLYTLNLQGTAESVPPGTLTYSWQESLDGTHYTVLPGGSTQNYTLTQAFTQANTWIERVVIVVLNGTTYTYTSTPITVQAVTPIILATISPVSLTPNPGTDPGPFTASAATGGNLVSSNSSMCGGNYTYIWQTSPDNLNWTNTSSTGLTYDPGVTSATTYVRLQATCGPTVGYTGTAVVNAYPTLQGGLISPMNITIASGTGPGNLTGSPATFGNVAAPGSAYTWYSSPDGNTWSLITGPITSQNYNPGDLTVTTWFMRKVSSEGQTAQSNAVEIQVGTPAAPGNSITTRVVTAAGITSYSAVQALTALGDVKQTNQYFDETGRLYQTVQKQGSLVTTTNANVDLITPFAYDPNGRQVFNYLSYPSAAATGAADVNPLPNQNAFNASLFQSQGDNFYYGQINYEPSPLARVNGVTAPGDNWTGGDRGNQALKTTNTADDQVLAWVVSVSGTPGVFSSYSYTSYYAAGMLEKSIALDEDGHQVITFKDLGGNVILKKVQLSANPDDGSGSGYSGWLCTYYMYDNWNNVRCIIQPQGVQLLSANGWNIAALSNAILNQQCFRYEYDARNRVIMTQVPGKQPEYFVYDNVDRVVMSQDGNLRQNSQWLVTLYESFLDRKVATGIWTNASLTFATALSAAYPTTSYPFTLTSTPTSGWELLTQTHYDNYTGLPSGLGTLNTATINTSNFYSSDNSSSNYAQPLTASTPSTTVTTQGLVTWTESEVLNGTPGSQYIWVAKIYDTRARVIQQQTLNYTGGIDFTTTQYSFGGLPLIHDELIHEGTTQTFEVATRNLYDALERLTEVDKMTVQPAALATSTWKVIVKDSYDAVGRLTSKSIGNNILGTGPLETQNYEYNVRGWPIGVNRSAINSAAMTPFFGYELAFDKGSTIIGGTTSYPNLQYNGNIGGTIWKNAADQQVKKYDYKYDAADRLTEADFNEYTGGTFNTSAGINYTVTGTAGGISYDANGNLTQMTQYGWKNGTSSQIDVLTYNYSPSGAPSSNQLQNVINANSDQNTTLGDFHYSPTYTATFSGGVKPSNAADYSYDPNGNLTSDKNKDITNIVYNYLNLARIITIAGNTSNGTITYIYDASGNKLAKQVMETGAIVNTVSTTITTTTTYIDEFVYQSLNYSNSALSALNYTYNLQFFGHEEGRVRAQYNNASNPNTISGLVFDYFLKDHLSNTRMVITEEVETDNYPTLTFEGNTSSDVANQNAIWDNAGGTSINVLSARSAPNGMPTGFSGSQFGSYCRFIGKTASGGAVGAAKLLRVMAGDVINSSVYVTYSSASIDNSSANGLTTLQYSLLNMLVNAGSALPVVEGSAAANALSSAQAGSSAVQNFFNTTWQETPTSNTVPKAYLHVLLFNDQFVFDNVNSQVIPLTSTAMNAAQLLPITNLTVPKNGYAYIYFANESNTTVYFDNFTLAVKRGPVLEANDYYPFGLTMAAISGTALKSVYPSNRYRYNGKELQNQEFSNGSGLEEYDYGARMYDPQLGVWHNPDPLSDQYVDLSPYSTSADNPIRYEDKDGRFLFTAIGALVGGVVGGVNAAIHHRNVWKGIGKGAVSGAIAGAVVDVTVATAGTGTIALVAAGALSGAAGNAAEQGLNNLDHTQKGFSFTKLGIAAGAGAVGGFAGSKIGGVVSRLISGATTGVGTGVSSGGVMAEVIPGELENIGAGVEGAANAAPSQPIDPNRLIHIFDKAEHALGDLVAKFGSEQAAYQAVEEAAQEAYEAGQLAVGANGVLPSGNAGNIINVDGVLVRLIGGRIVNGRVVISSFSRKGLP